VKVFAVCYYAPPQLTPQSIQIGRQLYHLDADVTLLYGRDAQFSNAYDQYPDFFQRIQALEVPDPGPVVKGLALRLWRRLAPIYGNIPDGFGPWRRKAYRPALADLQRGGYDALVSFGMPMSDHLLAYRLKQRTGLPWLVHFSDPWTRNPFHHQGPVAAPVNEWMERRVIACADQVLFTSQRTLDLVMSKYPRAWRDKAAVLPHAWDMDHFNGPAPAIEPAPAGVRHVIRHIGNCYGARSPAPLFEALARIQERSPSLLDGVCFDFVGYITPSMLDNAAYRSLRAGLVRVLGQVGYRTSLELARSAAALLVIDAPSKQESIFLPSKLIEYIGARRPVWGITPPGTSADLIAEWAGGPHACANPGDVEAIARMVEAGLAALERAPDGLPGPDEVLQRYSPGRVAGALRAHIAGAVARQAQGRLVGAGSAGNPGGA
jgi:hypothetical protein